MRRTSVLQEVRLVRFERLLDRLGRRQRAQEIAEIVREPMKLEPDGVGGERAAGCVRLMRGYGAKLIRLFGKGWRGPHGFAGYWEVSGDWLGLGQSDRRPKATLGTRTTAGE